MYKFNKFRLFCFFSHYSCFVSNFLFLFFTLKCQFFNNKNEKRIIPVPLELSYNCCPVGYGPAVVASFLTGKVIMFQQNITCSAVLRMGAGTIMVSNFLFMRKVAPYSYLCTPRIIYIRQVSFIHCFSSIRFHSVSILT